MGLRRNFGIRSMAGDCDRIERDAKERTGAGSGRICTRRGRLKEATRGGRGRKGEKVVGEEKGEGEIEEEQQAAVGWWRPSRGRTRDGWLMDLESWATRGRSERSVMSKEC